MSILLFLFSAIPLTDGGDGRTNADDAGPYVGAK
jgi:hypothetical protein